MATRPRYRCPEDGPEAVILGTPCPDGRPNYEVCVDELLRLHAEEIRAGVARGVRYGIQVFHDDHCPALAGGCCNCNCVVNLIVEHDPSEDN